MAGWRDDVVEGVEKTVTLKQNTHFDSQVDDNLEGYEVV
jgi:hypothetical protein